MLLPDDTKNWGSDPTTYPATGSPTGDSFGNEETAAADRQFYSDSPVSPQPKIDFPSEESDAQANPSGYIAPGSMDQDPKASYKERALQLARKAKKEAVKTTGSIQSEMGRAATSSNSRFGRMVGEMRKLRESGMFEGSEEEVRARVKEEAKKRVKDAVKDKTKGAAKNVAKDAAKEVAGDVAKQAAKTGAKAGGKAVAAGAVGAAEVGFGVATGGLGFIVDLLLDIAIALGVNDAVDAAFELSVGHIKQGRFLAIRAAMKVLMFVLLLVTIIFIFSVAGIFIGLPMLIALDIYAIIGIMLPNVALFQGFNIYEKLILTYLSVIAFIVFIAFIAGLTWFVCDESGLFTTAGQVLAYVPSTLVQWATGTDVAGWLPDACASINSIQGS